MSASQERAGHATRDAFAGALVLEMRTPLARVELAASQLLREATTPAARDLASRVSAAVDDLDELMGKLATLLAPSSAGQAPSLPLGPVLSALHQRLAPVMAARGAEWRVGAEPEADVRGDPRQAQRAMLALVRAGGELAGQGGSFTLGLQTAPDRIGLLLHCKPPAPHASDGAIRPLLDEVRELAARERGQLEERRVGEEVEVRLWLPQLVRADSGDAAGQTPSGATGG